MRDTLVRAAPLRARQKPSRQQLIRAAVITVLLLFTLFALPQFLSLYYIDTMTQVAVYSMVTLALGLLVGRVGLVSLGQVAVLALAAWVAARLLFETTQPYPVILIEAGLVTMAARASTATWPRETRPTRPTRTPSASVTIEYTATWVIVSM